MLINLYLYIKIWFIFFRYKNSLPTNSDIKNPAMEIDGWSLNFYWDDEGLLETKFPLIQGFQFVISYRTSLVIGLNNNEHGYLRSEKFDRSIYKLAKKYFPNWIGFQPSRNTYNPELSERMLRIQKVAIWRFEKDIDKDILKAVSPDNDS
ncbi:hypothetical protein [Tenacibaculum sp. 190524A05c]|uniref:Uncharacterized protein n=1 Tax=Tenacibaculum platacis TaxID=3137852 RepID=A0ABM9P0L9_9FLAO